MTAFLRAALLVLPLLALAGCSVNPATGEQSFTAFMSRSDEMEVGRREHAKILKEFGGAYDDRALAGYVAGVGVALARVSELPKLPFTITVLNDETVNAFALPGGYVYISRGLVALAGNEAELAGVLAHEIGHVTARHAAQRYSKAVAANVGLTLLGVLGSVAGAPSGLGDLASLGAQVYLQGYSREQELEADLLAVRYMSRAGYDPGALITFFHRMEAHQRLEAARQGRAGEADQYNILSTHPRTAQRIQQAMVLARAAPVVNPRKGRDAFLARIDGMLFGDDPSEGVRRGREFVHPGLGFRFAVPPGFTMFNTRRRVVARGPDEAVIVFDLAKTEEVRRAGSLGAYVRSEWGKAIALRGLEGITINAMEAVTGSGRLSTRGGTRDVRLIAIRERPGRVYRLAFITKPGTTRRLAEELRRTTYSFRRLTAEEARAIRPLRVRVFQVSAGDTPAALAERLPFPRYRLEWFEMLNGLSPGEALRPGRRIKLIIG